MGKKPPVGVLSVLKIDSGRHNSIKKSPTGVSAHQGEIWLAEAAPCRAIHPANHVAVGTIVADIVNPCVRAIIHIGIIANRFSGSVGAHNT